MKYIVATFYHFFAFPSYAEQRAAIKAKLISLGIKGTLLVTPEGINGTLAGTAEAVDKMIAYFEQKLAQQKIDYKLSSCDYAPFKRTKVKLKKETISLGVAAPLHQRGRYVSPQNWNALIADPDTLVLDTRNRYEVELGSFARAIDPQIANFKELPRFASSELANAKQKKIATFCTGGIRCEKFTAWLTEQGFEQVYHLQGGILKYIEEIPPEQSRWQGQCFVFDDRGAVDHDLSPVNAEA